MQKKIKVMVVDDNTNILELVSEKFKEHQDIEVSNVFSNSNKALEFLLNNYRDIDILLLDNIMPTMDGLSVVEALFKQNIISKIKVITMTGLYQEFTAKELMKYGVQYFILKPFDLDVLEERIKQVYFTINTNNIVAIEKKEEISNSHDINHIITKHLMSMGIPAHVKGFSYIREAINMMYEDREYVGAITTALYPEISNKFNTSSSRVERAIRHSIQITWDRGNIRNLFLNKPTNSEFMALVVEKIKLLNLEQKIS